MDDAQDIDDGIRMMLQSRAATSDAKLRKMAAAVRTLLECIGENPNREGLRDTPLRCANALLSLTKGYGMNASTVVNNAIFQQDYDGMIVVKDIAFHSLCEHHLVPFSGKVHIGYLPRHRQIIGLSKLARIVEMYARRLQIQERLTKEIAEAITEVMENNDVAVAVEASHMCMAMRGVEKTGTTTITTCWMGQFDSRYCLHHQDFLNIIRIGGK